MSLYATRRLALGCTCAAEQPSTIQMGTDDIVPLRMRLPPWQLVSLHAMGGVLRGVARPSGEVFAGCTRHATFLQLYPTLEKPLNPKPFPTAHTT